MSNSNDSRTLELRNEIQQLEEEMLRVDVGSRIYNNLKNEQWNLINKLKKLESDSN